MKARRKNIFSRLFGRPVILCVVSFLLCFVLALLLFVPLDPLARQLEQAALKQQLQLKIGSVAPRLPLGLEFGQLTLGSPQLADHSLQIDQLQVQPQWLSLFGKNPALDYQLQAYQGSGQGNAARNGTMRLHLADLLVQESLKPQLPLDLMAQLKAADFSGQLPLAGQNSSTLQLELSALRLTGMQQLGSGADLLDLGRVSVTAEATGPLVRITALTVDGPALSLQGTGSLRVGRTPASSSLNLGLTLTPRSELDPMLKDLLSIMKKPQRDGTYRINIGGALTSLRIK